MIGYMVPNPPAINPKATVAAHAADATLTADDMGQNHTNTGASGGITLTLPAASDAAGCGFRVQVTVAQIVTLDPQTGKIYLGGSGVADKTLGIAGVIGNYADLYSDGDAWLVMGYSGVLTKEA